MRFLTDKYIKIKPRDDFTSPKGGFGYSFSNKLNSDRLAENNRPYFTVGAVTTNTIDGAGSIGVLFRTAPFCINRIDNDGRVCKSTKSQSQDDTSKILARRIEDYTYTHTHN